MNVLYYGDNLDVLRRHIEDAFVDLIYLDPPFSSNASYNVLFAERDGTHAASQIKRLDEAIQHSSNLRCSTDYRLEFARRHEAEAVRELQLDLHFTLRSKSNLQVIQERPVLLAAFPFPDIGRD